MHVVVVEAKNLTVIDYFIVFFFEVFSIVEMLKEFSNCCGWIPTYSQAIIIDGEVGGGVGSVLSVYMSKKSKWFILKKIVDAIFEISRVFLCTLTSDHGEENNVKFTVYGEFFFVIFIEAYKFSDLIGYDNVIDKSRSGICGWCKWVFIVETIKL